MLKLIEEIIGHLGAAQVQRAAHDDSIIAVHIDEALTAAKALRDRVGWHDLARKKPKNSEMVVATDDGNARWLEIWYDSVPEMTWEGHKATHWHALPPSMRNGP